MKKFLVQFILILAVVAVAGFAGWKILNSKPAAAKASEHGHGEEGGEEHGHEGHGHEAHGEEGHVELNAEQRKNANLGIEEAGPARIKTSLTVYGKIATNEEKMAHVMPRFPGIVKSVRKRIGDQVNKGDVLAIVESNESLRGYDIVAEVPGTITFRDITLGEFVGTDKAIFTIVDMSTVWVDLNIYRQDFAQLKEGQEVEIHIGEHDSEPIPAKIDYISPFGAESTQTMLARAIIPNPRGDLRPGFFVTAEIITGQIEAPIAIKASALQTLKEKTVVFVEEGDAFEAREVELGARDSEKVEVTSGLLPGDRYVAQNSFILKAELGKGEAAHEH